MTEISPDQALQRSLDLMGEPFGRLYDRLRTETTWLHLKWSDYRLLFAVDEKQIDFLNSAAPAFFAHLQTVLSEDILLHICRLTDPAKQNRDKYRNLSLPQFLDQLHQISGLNQEQAEKLKKALDDGISKAKQKSEFARDWRDRWIAHRELPKECGGNRDEEVNGWSRTKVEGALQAIRCVMKCVESQFKMTTVCYELSIPPLGGVESLLERIRLGHQVRQERLDSLRGREP